MTQQPSDPTPAGSGSTPGAIPEEQLKGALTAFRKRLKFTKLDQESKISGHSPLTSGKKSDVMGIVPPTQYPPAVWKELARLGRLKDMGGGFYRLP
jgi:hypothetical protein